jgi:hypothetical protein
MYKEAVTVSWHPGAGAVRSKPLEAPPDTGPALPGVLGRGMMWQTENKKALVLRASAARLALTERRTLESVSKTRRRARCSSALCRKRSGGLGQRVRAARAGAASSQKDARGQGPRPGDARTGSEKRIAAPQRPLLSVLAGPALRARLRDLCRPPRLHGLLAAWRCDAARALTGPPPSKYTPPDLPFARSSSPASCHEPRPGSAGGEAACMTHRTWAG